MTKTQAMDTLDKYDLKEWVRLCLFFGVRDPYSIIAYTNTWFDDEKMYNAINELSVEDFMAYLESRYDVVFDEEPVCYRMREK